MAKRTVFFNSVNGMVLLPLLYCTGKEKKQRDRAVLTVRRNVVCIGNGSIRYK